MYDTLHLWLPSYEAGGYNLAALLQSLTNVGQHQRVENQVSYSGNLGGNLKVNIVESGISIKGSISKYFLGDNFHSLTRSDTQRAIEQLSDELLLPVLKANVTRVDVAQNIHVEQPPQVYYPYLGECQYFKRLVQPDSVYYSNGNRQKLFYNKVKEGKAKHEQLPKVWNGENILRFEARFSRRLKDQFNLSEVKASTLIEEPFYIQMFDRWLNEYQEIHKLNKLNLNYTEMKSPKDFFTQMALITINTIGQDKAVELVEEMRATKTFEKPEYYSRLKKEIRELCNKSSLTAKSELIEELDKKVKDRKNFYR